MTSIRTHAEEYLAMRRSLGYQLFCQGRLLLDFADQMDRAGQTRLTTIAALAWATQTPDTLPVTRRMRLSVVRCFARHLKTLDPTCEVPPSGLLAAAARRPTPYLYSPQEISALVHAAQTLAKPLAAATYQALVSLLAVTGLRIAEALALQRADVDLDIGVLRVTGKYAKVRLVPLHATTITMLTSYVARRDQLCPVPHGTSFFITCTGRSIHPTLPARRSGSFWTGPASTRRPDDAVPAFMISGTPSPSTPTCAGIATASMFRRTHPSCPPSWGTGVRPTPTGT